MRAQRHRPSLSPRRRAASRSTSSVGRSASRTSTSPPSAVSTCLTVEHGGEVQVTSLLVSNDTLHDLEEHLCMFFTGYSRHADQTCSRSSARSSRPPVTSTWSRASTSSNTSDSPVEGRLGTGRHRYGSPRSMDEHWRAQEAAARRSCRTRHRPWYGSAWRAGLWGASSWGRGPAGSCCSTPRTPTACARPWAPRV